MTKKTYIWESFEETMLFAENLGWVVPPEIEETVVDDLDYLDAIEDNALSFIESKGYTIKI